MKRQRPFPRVAATGFLVLLASGCTGSVAPVGVANPPPNGAGGNGIAQQPPGSGSQSGGGPTGQGQGAAIGSGNGAGGGGTSGGLATCDALTSRRVRRLSRREYANVVSDLLGAPAATATLAALAPEPRVGGFDNQDSFLFVSPFFQESVANLAAALAAQSDPAALAPCAGAAGTPACLQTFIRAFSSKAYGRPLTDPEIARATAVANLGETYATSVRLVVELVLQSPNLLYVTELGAPTVVAKSAQPVALTSYEMASQLAFLLSGTRPDATLLKAAETTGFATPADIQREAERMLATPRAQAELARFITGWLDMGPVAESPKSPAFFPQFTDAIAAAMQQEFDQFVSTQLKGGNGTLAAFMSETSTNVPTALGSIYGADLLPAGLDPRHRRGVLSLPAVLSFHATDLHSGPVERGLLVRRQLLCQYIPGPPQAALDRIAANPVDANDRATTTRQKFQVHLDEATCKGCHASFDPIGFGFEQMDGIGRFRTTENGMPVDSSGQLTLTDVDGSFEGPAALSAMLASSKMLASCMVDHFFSFAQARPTVPADQCVVQDWAEKFSRNGGRIKDLVLNYVVAPSFSSRRDDR